LRVNGHAHVSIDPDLLATFEMDGRHPRSVVVITVSEIYFQCARAIMRAQLWNPERFVDPASLPTPGMMLEAAKEDFDRETYDREWPARAAATMW
ncbi:MAG TPA: pyridoxamine 5'-phosphate oxidase family protein, partial [Pseudorhizobium sp.]|nr:pyridoxamine 5'-phosphate oxidase family protein [Pseudorhizobium sp.]